MAKIPIVIAVLCMILVVLNAAVAEVASKMAHNHNSQHHNRRQRRLSVDTSKFKKALDSLNDAANLIYQRYQFDHADWFQFFIGTSNMPSYGWDLIKYKIAQKILKGGEQYLMIFGGTSVTAGHDNYYNQSYPFVFERRMKKPFSDLGIKLLVHNIAQGGNNCRPSDHCYNSMGGDNADFMSWEQSFNCGRSKDVMEFMARYAYWNGAVMYYVASGGFSTDYCKPSSDKIPWVREDWTPEKVGITHKYQITKANASEYRKMQGDWYDDGNSVSRFTNQVFGGLYCGTGPHGYSVWGHSSKLCNNGKGCNALDVKGECLENGGPHWMVKDSSYFAMDRDATGKSWHPPAAMHLMRGELLAYNYAHIVADALYMILDDIANPTFANNVTGLIAEYHAKWQQLRVPIPENALHSRSEETKVLPICFTDFRPHYNPPFLLSSIIIGGYEGWQLKEYDEHEGSKYAYGDVRPFFETTGAGKELHFRIGNVREGVVRVCGYTKKTGLAHVNYFIDPNYKFPNGTANKDIKYVPTDKRVELTVKDNVGDDCWRLPNVPLGGEHVLVLRTEPNSPNHMTSVSHIVIF